jgi:hypothetical protein
MSLPKNTSAVIKAAFGDTDCCSLVEVAGEITIHQWTHATQPKPTVKQVTDWASDAVALPSGQLFSEWIDEHDGDVKKTQKRLIRESLRHSEDVAIVGLRALMDVVATHLKVPRKDIRAAVLDRMLKLVDTPE